MHEELVDTYLSEINHRLLTAEEERRASVDELVANNLALVVHIAKRFRNRGLEYIDLISEGNFGLIEAAKRYDGRGRFSTYAVIWIKAAMRRALERLPDPVRLPSHHTQTMARILEAQRKLDQEKQQLATQEEVAEAVGLTLDRLQRILGTRGAASLDEEHENEGDSLRDRLPAAQPGQASSELAQQLRERLARLEERQARALVLRYVEEKSLSAIALQLGISRERVRQICAGGLCAMRSSE